jgi:hypothetical protein
MGARSGVVGRAWAILLVVAACASCSTGTGMPPTSGYSSEAGVGSGSPDPSVAPAPSTSVSPAPTSSVSSPVVGAAGSALAALMRLPIKGRAPMTGYRRVEFGPSWPDVDHNGCDTRNDILRRDLRRIIFRASSPDCVVATGVLVDPYTGMTIDFVRGVATSARVQIDHVVALGDAWQKGAQRLSADRRTAFANDPLNLLAVGGAINQSKSDGDAATWLPPMTAFRCSYVARQVAVKSRWGLWVTLAERDAMQRILMRCPKQPLPLH